LFCFLESAASPSRSCLHTGHTSYILSTAFNNHLERRWRSGPVAYRLLPSVLKVQILPASIYPYGASHRIAAYQSATARTQQHRRRKLTKRTKRRRMHAPTLGLCSAQETCPASIGPLTEPQFDVVPARPCLKDIQLPAWDYGNVRPSRERRRKY